MRPNYEEPQVFPPSELSHKNASMGKGRKQMGKWLKQVEDEKW